MLRRIIISFVLQICVAMVAVELKAAPPNIVLIISDDQSAGTISEFMPTTQSEIFDKGIQFTKAYATTPRCGPSRATMLTGQYAARHGVFRNGGSLSEKTLVNDLRDNGYYTGLVGKYLNSWNGEVRSEFNYWVSHRGGGAQYYNPRLNVNGRWMTVPGYATEFYQERALIFLRKAARVKRPFFLMFAPSAPHRPAVPARQDRKLFLNMAEPRPPSFLEEDLSDKPMWLRSLAESRIGWQPSTRFWHKQQQTMVSVDRAVGAMLEEMEKHKQLKNTVIIYASDNGLLHGEHWLNGKDCGYEEAVAVPFAMRVPGIAPQVSDALVANIDFVPTLLELAGVSTQRVVDGVSLKPLWSGGTLARERILIEGWGNNQSKNPSFVGAHSGRYKLVNYENDISELYDLETDPFEMENRIADPELEDVRVKLERSLLNRPTS